MTLAEELENKHGFIPDEPLPQAWMANRAIARAVNEALERAAQECEKRANKYARQARAKTGEVARIAHNQALACNAMADTIRALKSEAV